MTGLTSVPGAYVPIAAPGNTLQDADHDDGLHAVDRTAIRNLILEAWALGLPLSVNGNFDHFEQMGSATQTSTTTYNTTTSYAADQKFVRPVGASVTQARSTTVPDTKSRFSLAVVGAASVTTVDIGERIESAIINTRGKQSLVFSCYVRNESGAAFTPKLRIGTPAAADDFTTVTNRLDQSLQSCADSAWTRVYHVFDPSGYTNIANGMEVVLQIPSGSLVSGDTVRIAQFDLRPGAALAPYIATDPAIELVRCRRYMRVVGGGDANEVMAAVGQCTSTTIGRSDVPLEPPMRVAPTGSVSAAADWAVAASTGALQAGSSIGFALGTPRSIAIAVTVASGLVAGDACRMNANGTTNARLYLNARL